MAPGPAPWDSGKALSIAAAKGGYTLKRDGAILGGIGISGGSPDEDQQICEDNGADAHLRQVRAVLAVR